MKNASTFIKNKIFVYTIILGIAVAISLVVAPLSVVLLYYSYTGALGIESVFIDMLLAFISYFIALSVSSHFLKYSEPNK